MTNTPSRKLWQFPWQYRESALFIGGLAAVGFALQLAVGHFDFFLLHAPANLFASAALVALILLGTLCRRTALVRWLSGVPFAVCCVAALLLFSLIMGLTPQVARVDPHAHNIFSDLGFTRVTASWPFVFLYAVTLLSLGLTVARRLTTFKKRDLAFCCNHLGLWILLLAAGMGAADMQRFVMYVREGETEWRVYSAAKDVLELPVAIKLKDFSMEEYPPKLVIINRESGIPQPEGRPWTFQIDEKRPQGALGEWSLTLEEYLHEAVKTGDLYRHSPMPASTPAARVKAVNARTGETKTGWVCGGGNIPGFFASLALDEKHTLVMTEPEPKRFASDITVLTKDGITKNAVLEVNKPVRAGSWMIYQYGYDNQAGKMSTYSSMELVHDAWLVPAYAGIALMVAGSMLLIFTGTGKRRKAS
ncbi:cytochrome c biogenesis protein ResB [Desulfovibrio sp. OttesenSCG-928-O18]|nr:cytochrome c biogenesis protein ResB [Desulfovibrio sp. OttesenSCG-928-O18]